MSVYSDPLYRRNAAIVRACAIGSLCPFCGTVIEHGQRVDADHIVGVAESLALGLPPDHSLANLRPAHRSCNEGGKPPRQPPASRAEIYTRDQ